MALPPGRPTLQALSTGNWTRPDNVWCTSHTLDLLIHCDTDPGLRGPNTDHIPILTVFDTPITRNKRIPSPNFRATDWNKFRNHLNATLSNNPEPRRLNLNEEFRAALNVISTSIRSAITANVPMTKPLPHAKRWWTQELSNMRKRKNRLSRESHHWRGLPDHESHQKHREVSKEYAMLIERTKKMHWEEWLLNASEKDIWTANKYVTDPPINGGGRTRMPTLNFTGRNGEPRRTTSNAEKSNVLASSFFPPPPASPSIPLTSYPEPAKHLQILHEGADQEGRQQARCLQSTGPRRDPKRCAQRVH